MNTTQKQTLGESRVRVSFNPDNNSEVDTVKTMIAKLIDFCEEARGDKSALADGEKMRLISLAQTAFEDGGHWIVKALTYGK